MQMYIFFLMESFKATHGYNTIIYFQQMFIHLHKTWIYAHQKHTKVRKKEDRNNNSASSSSSQVLTSNQTYYNKT